MDNSFDKDNEFNYSSSDFQSFLAMPDASDTDKMRLQLCINNIQIVTLNYELKEITEEEYQRKIKRLVRKAIRIIDDIKKEKK